MNPVRSKYAGRHRFSAELLTVLLLSLFVSGECFSREAGAAAPIMKSYVILFRQGPFTFTEELSARRQREIVAWAAKHQAAGHRLDPRALEPDVLRPGVATPDDATAWPIVALVFLEAHDLEEAAAIAADHPAKHYNVSTEVRPWLARKIPEPKS